MSKFSRREFLQQGLTGVAAATLGTSALRAVEPAASDNPKVGKKGIGYKFKDSKGWDKLKALNVHWLYNWGTSVAEGKPDELDYVPMIWRGNEDKTPPRIDGLKGKGHRTLLGFNEPDQKDQANMTVDQSLELWPALMESGLRLGSPGAAKPDKEWMKEFMAKAAEKKYRIDFVCVHWYWHPDPEDFLAKIRSYHKLFNLPIWITEFGVADWEAKPDQPNRFTADEVAEFLKKVLPVLEKTPWLERYAWFPSSPDSLPLGSSALFDKDNKLTKVGQVYAAG